MRLLFWRRPKPARDAAPAEPSSTRQRGPSPHEVANSQLSEALAFARTYFQAVGARTTAQTPSTLSVTLPDGHTRHYTDSPTDLQREPASELLVPGSTALTAMLDDVAAHARLLAFRVPPAASAEATVRQAVAPPAKNCGRCLETSGEPIETCDACPLRTGARVLGGLGRITSTRVVREWEEVSVELAFTVTARDHYGRIDNLVRVAFDPSGSATPLVPEAAIARAENSTTPRDFERHLTAALASARRELERRANAIAAFLSLRGSADYARRRDEINGAYSAMQTEPDADRAALSRALTKEMSRLAEIYGAEVEVRLASAAFVTTLMAEVELTDDARQALLATLDLGRGLVRSATWNAPLGVAAPSTPPMAAHQPATDGAPFTADSLELLPPAAFAEAIRWLIERTGARVNSSHETDSGLCFTGARDGRPLTALALPAMPESALTARHVRQAAALATGSRDAATLLITTHPSSEVARAEAQRLSVEFWDRAELDTLLADQAVRYDRAARQRVAQIEARIAITAEIRAQIIQAVEAMETALATPQPAEKLRTQPKIAAAVASIERGKLATQRSLLACQTLVADLRAAFGERPSRDGSLEIVATEATLEELRARVEHLAPIAIAATREVAAQPATGDFGYSALRKAVMEELTARCESVRWRALTIDPPNWRDYGKALDARAAMQADVSAAAADRAATRAALLAAEINSRAVASS